jgi:GNAT superfamily N-acetyltransferase
MYLDTIPDCSYAKLIRSGARVMALRDDGRAVGVVGVSDGAAIPADTIVRFDLVKGEDPGRRLRDALAQTATRAFWFYGGDDVARRAAADLQFPLEPRGAVFVRRMDPVIRMADLTLRPPGPRDRMTLSEVHADQAPGFTAPETLFAQLGNDVVGVAMSEALDPEWTELRVVVYPAYRGRGIGSAIFTAAADKLESAGRLVCAAIETTEGRGRTALENAGFRLADYYFIARRPARER